MIFNPGKAILSWWQNASPRARFVGGTILFSLVCTAALFALLDSPSTGGAVVDSSPLYFAGAFLKLIFVLCLIVGGAAIARRYAGRAVRSGPARQLEVIETTRLAPRQSLVLVRAGNRRLLVGATDGVLSLISDLGEIAEETGAAETETPPMVELSFQSILTSAAQQADAAVRSA